MDAHASCFRPARPMARPTKKSTASRISISLPSTLYDELDAMVLARGYAVCWNDARTSIIRSARAVKPGDGVRVTLANGELACRVEQAE